LVCDFAKTFGAAEGRTRLSQKQRATIVNISYRKQNAVAIITINRPDRHNAVDHTSAAELVTAFARFDEDETAHDAILTGAKGGGFCSRADLKALSEGDGNRVSKDSDGPMGISPLAFEAMVA
jgi:enoyl-CoA hydratase